jgi:CheY-like chemotaxis protein
MMMTIKILLIEDDKDMIEDLRHLMSQYDIDVDYFLITPGMKISMLRKKIKSKPYDCLVLDIRMPTTAGMTNDETEGGRRTGVLLCHQIRKVLPTTPILVFTAVSDPDVQQAILKEGASRIINKPEQPDLLAEWIKKLVRSM